MSRILKDQVEGGQTSTALEVQP